MDFEKHKNRLNSIEELFTPNEMGEVQISEDTMFASEFAMQLAKTEALVSIAESLENIALEMKRKKLNI